MRNVFVEEINSELIPEPISRWKWFSTRADRQIEQLESRVLFSHDPAVIALVDTRLPDQQLLAQSLQNVTTLFFDSQTESATSVLERTIAAARGMDGPLGSVMIFSHGESGRFMLGDDVVSSATLAQTAAQWEALGRELAPDGSIHLFACDLADGVAGRELLEQLHALTNADIFGSTDITGKNGDWQLEAASSGAATPTLLPIRTELLGAYSAALGIVTIQTPASATPNPVSGTTTDLSVLAADTTGEAGVTYTWSATIAPPGANPLFSINGSNAAKNTTVTFDQAGLYTFTVTAVDGLFFATSSVIVTVNATLTSIAVSPSSASLTSNQLQLFTASGLDQFGQTLLVPPIVTWSVDSGGVGSIDSLLGLYSAGTTSGSAVVRATSGSVSGTANVTVNNPSPTVVLPASATPNPVTGTTSALTVLGNDDQLELNLTYTWAATTQPAGSNPTFSINGNNLAKISTVTFDQAGTYTLTVTISDGSSSTTSSVVVVVDQTLTSVVVNPATANLAPNATQQFSATAIDQFGDPLAVQPAFTWSLLPLSAGSIDSNGLYTAPNSAGAATVQATTGTLFFDVATVTVGNNAPTVLLPASAIPNPVTGTTTVLSVLGLDDGLEPNLTYTWAATAQPAGSNPVFSINGNNLAKVSTVTFNRAGSYTLTVTISDGSLSTTSSVVVVVNQTLTSVAVTPSSVSLSPNATQQFSATALDQFGDAMIGQPAFTWSLLPLSVGSINASGLYTAPNSAGTATVVATTGLLSSGTANVTVGNTAPVALLGAAATPNPVNGTTSALSVLGADDGGELNLTYTWAATALPPGAAPSFSANGTNLSKLSVVTFDQAGTYTFTVTISDGFLSTTSSVVVVVNQTLSSVSVTPASVGLAPGGTQQFSATARDQFGDPMAAQPAFTWSLTLLSVGSISSGGLYTAPAFTGTATVQASAGLLISGFATVVVSVPPIDLPDPPVPPVDPPPPPPLDDPTEPTDPVIPTPPVDPTTPSVPEVPLPETRDPDSSAPTLPTPEAATTVPPDQTPRGQGDLASESDVVELAPLQRISAVGFRVADPVAAFSDSSPTIRIHLAATLALTIGFVAHLLIPASWLSTLFTSLPAWRWFDPVPVLQARRAKQVRSRVLYPRPLNPEASSLRSLLK